VIVSGIAADPRADLQGHRLLGGAVDTTRLVKLYHEHSREIGEVVAMHYIGNDLFVTCETDDAEALRAGFFSVAGKPIVREAHGNGWLVAKFQLTEISLVKSPANDRCKVLDRKPSDPMRKYIKARGHEIDLTIQRIQCLGKYLQLAGRQLCP